MPYPDTSDWTTAVPNSAWFYDRTERRACQTSGRGFLDSVFSRAQDRIEGAGGSLPWSGGVVFLSDLADDSAWSIAAFQAIDALAMRDRAPADFLTATAAAAQSGTMTPLAMQAAIWVATLNKGYGSNGDPIYGIGSPDRIELGGQIALPYLGLSIPRPATGHVEPGLNCIPVANFTPSSPTPIRDPGSAPYTTVLAFGLLVAAVVAAAVITSNTPTAVPGRR